MSKQRRKVLNAQYDVKQHYKMYKAGKNWLFTGISLATFGSVLLFGTGNAKADTTTAATTDSADTASLTASAASELTAQQVALKTSVTSTAATTATTSTATSAASTTAESSAATENGASNATSTAAVSTTTTSAKVATSIVSSTSAVVKSTASTTSTAAASTASGPSASAETDVVASTSDAKTSGASVPASTSAKVATDATSGTATTAPTTDSAAAVLAQLPTGTTATTAADDSIQFELPVGADITAAKQIIAAADLDTAVTLAAKEADAAGNVTVSSDDVDQYFKFSGKADGKTWTPQYDDKTGTVTLTTEDPVLLGDGTTSAKSQVGSMTLNVPINMTASFKLTGAVQLLGSNATADGGSTDNTLSAADGIGFAFYSVDDTNVGAAGWGLGISGLEEGFGFKFDTWQNSETSDPTAPFGSFVYNDANAAWKAVNDTATIQSLGSLTRGVLVDIEVAYDGATKTMTVTYGTDNPVTWTKNLSDLIGDNQAMSFAITSSTGWNHNTQLLRLDSFNYVQSYPTTVDFVLPDGTAVQNDGSDYSVTVSRSSATAGVDLTRDDTVIAALKALNDATPGYTYTIATADQLSGQTQPTSVVFGTGLSSTQKLYVVKTANDQTFVVGQTGAPAGVSGFTYSVTHSDGTTQADLTGTYGATIDAKYGDTVVITPAAVAGYAVKDSTGTVITDKTLSVSEDNTANSINVSYVAMEQSYSVVRGDTTGATANTFKYTLNNDSTELTGTFGTALTLHTGDIINILPEAVAGYSVTPMITATVSAVSTENKATVNYAAKQALITIKYQDYFNHDIAADAIITGNYGDTITLNDKTPSVSGYFFDATDSKNQSGTNVSFSTVDTDGNVLATYNGKTVTEITLYYQANYTAQIATGGTKTYDTKGIYAEESNLPAVVLTAAAGVSETATPTIAWEAKDFDYYVGDKKVDNTSNAGVYTIKLSTSGQAKVDALTGYKVTTKDGDYTITPANAEITISSGNGNYTGKPLSFIPTIKNNSDSKLPVNSLIDQADFTYTNTAGEEVTLVGAGNYTVKLSDQGKQDLIAANANFNLTNLDTATGTYTINPAIATINLSTGDSKVYDGAAITFVPAVVLSGVASDVTVPAAYQLQSADYVITTTDGTQDNKGAGMYTFTLTAAGAQRIKDYYANFNLTGLDKTLTSTYTISKATVNVILNSANLAYTAGTTSYNLSLGDATITGVVAGEDLGLTLDQGLEYPGSKLISAHATADAAVLRNYDITVTPATLTVTGDAEKAITQTITYTGAGTATPTAPDSRTVVYDVTTDKATGTPVYTLANNKLSEVTIPLVAGFTAMIGAVPLKKKDDGSGYILTTDDLVSTSQTELPTLANIVITYVANEEKVAVSAMGNKTGTAFKYTLNDGTDQIAGVYGTTLSGVHFGDKITIIPDVQTGYSGSDSRTLTVGEDETKNIVQVNYVAAEQTLTVQYIVEGSNIVLGSVSIKGVTDSQYTIAQPLNQLKISYASGIVAGVPNDTVVTTVAIAALDTDKLPTLTGQFTNGGNTINVYYKAIPYTINTAYYVATSSGSYTQLQTGTATYDPATAEIMFTGVPEGYTEPTNLLVHIIDASDPAEEYMSNGQLSAAFITIDGLTGELEINPETAAVRDQPNTTITPYFEVTPLSQAVTVTASNNTSTEFKYTVDGGAELTGEYGKELPDVVTGNVIKIISAAQAGYAYTQSAGSITAGTTNQATVTYVKTAVSNPADITYGGSIPNFTLDLGAGLNIPAGLANSDFIIKDAKYTDAGNLYLAAGEYTISLNSDGLAKLKDTNPGYVFDENSVSVGKLVVAKKDATITISAGSYEYDGQNHQLDPVIVGTVNGETLDYTLTDNSQTTVGSHTVSIKLPTESAINANYNITPSAGATLAVTAKKIISSDIGIDVSVVNQVINEGANTPTFTLSFGDNLAKVTVTNEDFIFTQNGKLISGIPTVAGSYTVSLSDEAQERITKQQNYALTASQFISGSYVIKQVIKDQIGGTTTLVTDEQGRVTVIDKLWANGDQTHVEIDTTTNEAVATETPVGAESLPAVKVESGANKVVGKTTVSNTQANGALTLTRVDATSMVSEQVGSDGNVNYTKTAVGVPVAVDPTDAYTTKVTKDPDGGTITVTTDGNSAVTEISKTWPDGDQTEVKVDPVTGMIIVIETPTGEAALPAVVVDPGETITTGQTTLSNVAAPNVVTLTHDAEDGSGKTGGETVATDGTISYNKTAVGVPVSVDPTDAYTTEVTKDPDGGTTTITKNGNDQVTAINKVWPDGDETAVTVDPATGVMTVTETPNDGIPLAPVTVSKGTTVKVGDTTVENSGLATITHVTGENATGETVDSSGNISYTKTAVDVPAVSVNVTDYYTTTKVKDPDGGVTTLTSDGNGRVTAIDKIWANGDQTHVEVGTTGQLTVTETPAGQNALPERIVAPNQTITLTHGDGSSLTVANDQLDGVVLTQIDGRQTIKETVTTGGEVSYTRTPIKVVDGHNNHEQVTTTPDKNGGTTTTTVNEHNRVTVLDKVWPNGDRTQITVDPTTGIATITETPKNQPAQTITILANGQINLTLSDGSSLRIKNTAGTITFNWTAKTGARYVENVSQTGERMAYYVPARRPQSTDVTAQIEQAKQLKVNLAALSAAKQAKLPQTGDASGTAATAAGLALLSSIFGFFSVRRKKEDEQ